MTEPEIMDIPLTAKFLRVNRDTLYGWVKRADNGEGTHPIPFFRIGRSLRFRRSELYRWIEAQECRRDPMPPPRPSIRDRISSLEEARKKRAAA